MVTMMMMIMMIMTMMITDYIWLHIRGVGQWTNTLYEYFEKEHAKLHAGEVPAEHE